PGEENLGAEDGENAENLGTPLSFKSPTVTSSIPVTGAESDFDDLDGDEPVETSSPSFAEEIAAVEAAAIEPAKTLISETVALPPATSTMAPVVTITAPSIETVAESMPAATTA